MPGARQSQRDHEAAAGAIARRDASTVYLTIFARASADHPLPERWSNRTVQYEHGFAPPHRTWMRCSSRVHDIEFDRVGIAARLGASSSG
jgi:hypothetical protein